MYKNIFLKIISLLLLLSLAAGCGKSEAPAKKQLVLCSSMGRQLTELFADNYSKATGTKVKISYLPAGTQKERFDYLRQNKFDVWLGGTSEEYFLAD